METDRSAASVAKALTKDVLLDLVGPTILSRGQRYHRSGQVEEIAIAPDGSLIAWVSGTRRYATLVGVQADSLAAACTCPYPDVCKHIVAAVLQYQEDMEENKPIPVATEDDPRLTALEDAGWEWEEMGWNPPHAGRGSAAEALPGPLVSYVEGQTREQLVELVKELAARHPDVRENLQARHDLARGKVTRLAQGVRKEVRALSAEPGWFNPWSGEGYIPDYSGVRERLEALLEAGYADEVVGLGKELLEAGNQQVEMSHDEGETEGEIATCLAVVFRALPHSSLPRVEQMLWVVEAEIADQFEMTGGSGAFWEGEFAASDWSALADRLGPWLESEFGAGSPADDDYVRHYRRDRLADWLIEALDRGGRQDEALAVCEREATANGAYVRLVKRLRAAGRREDAAHWAHEGIRATQERLPGIAANLRDALREMREEAGDWLGSAAFRARDLFQRPSLSSFKELRQAARRCRAWPAVRAHALRFLEIGQVPQAGEHAPEEQGLPPWPLPEVETEAPRPVSHLAFPATRVLIEIAIAERRPDDVLHWYDRRPSAPMGFGWYGLEDDRVAEAVADSYPERAVAIWKNLAESLIARVQPRAYDEAGGYLRKMRKAQKEMGQEAAWKRYLAELRQAHHRKRRLLDVLNGLEQRGR